MNKRYNPTATSPEATEEEEDFVREEINLGEVLSAEIEIKEEEVELDDSLFSPADETRDPIGEDCQDSETSGDEVIHRDALQLRKRKLKRKPGSSTETADESLGGFGKGKKKHPTGVKRIRKKWRKITYNGWIVPRFVPGMMVQRKKQLLCLECGQQFDSIVLFATHATRFHLAGLKSYPHSCFYCPRKFRRRLTLQQHLLHHTRFEALRCPICRETFYSAIVLANHMAKHQVIPKKTEVVPIAKIPIFSKIVRPLDNVCFVCGVSKATEDALTSHVNCHEDLLQCKACYEMLSTASEFLEHVQTVHNNQADLTYYTCPHPHCSQSFLSASEMQKHSQNCTPPKPPPEKRPFSGTPLNCGICNLTYYEVDHFATHMRLHSALAREIPGQRACSLCVFAGNDASEYANHMIHSHGYRDRMASLVEAYSKLNIVSPD